MMLSKKYSIWGILNVTPDSFYDGGIYLNTNKAIDKAFKMAEEGANVIDIGGESTRPYAKKVSIQEELDRVLPIIESLINNKISIPISIDTQHTEVMELAINAGASIINDINALQDIDAVITAAKLKVPVVLMHMQGNPQNMQINPKYNDIIFEIIEFLKFRIDVCIKNGILKDNIIIDPGFGFGKSVEDNFKILKNLEKFKVLGCPIFVGMSRKSMFSKLLKIDTRETLVASSVAVAIAKKNGATIFRTHDVKETKQALEISEVGY